MQSVTHANTGEPVTRVSTLELFFDLVFVFTITQVSHLVLHAHDLLEVLSALLVLTVIWWMYGGYAWLTNNVGTAHPANRFLVLAAMACFLVMALAVPEAFGRDGVAFGLAYLLVNLIHTVLFTRSFNQSSAQAIWQIAPLNIGTALLVLGAGFTPPAWSWLLWVGAVLALASMPLFGKIGGFAVQPTHFVERHGLVLIVALGESIVSIGAGTGGAPVTPDLVLAVVLTLALTAALWWSYFDQDEQRAEHALSAVSGAARARMALYAFGYAHLVMIAGVVLTAAGLRLLIEQLHESAHLFTNVLLASGVALFLLGDVLFRRAIGVPSSRLRLALVPVALATTGVGALAGGLVQVGALLLIFVAMLVWERAEAAR